MWSSSTPHSDEQPANSLDDEDLVLMTSKIVDAEIVDGRLVLPPEAQALLPAGVPLSMVIDEGKERITVYAKDLRKQLDDADDLMEALADLNAGLTDEQYTRTFSEGELRRQRGDDDEAAK
jgi:hypothetical protein